ncbi:MAG: hypothetical protein IBX40_06590 [Methanosarcinales archaeon]|nr:hypothetical protein [Methanosarcinales archaeon]
MSINTYKSKINNPHLAGVSKFQEESFSLLCFEIFPVPKKEYGRRLSSKSTEIIVRGQSIYCDNDIVYPDEIKNTEV